jgi:hypothetical protein
LITNVVGGGPVCTGTAGAPGGSAPVVATHGLPAADFSGAAVVDDVDDVDEVEDVVVDEVFLESRFGLNRTITITTTMAPATTPLMMPRRR